jgi:predicted component of type VI protein secretion system
MPAQLLALNGGPSILLDKPILLLGRHPECDIQIDSRKISRRHCCIAQVHDYLVVRDLDSTNGIRINGVRVTEGKLNPGDELTIGSHRYQVVWDEPGPAGRSAAAAPPLPAAGPPRPAAAAPLGERVPVSLGEVEDELLESFDEPVPLAEPEPRSPLPAKAPPPLPAVAGPRREEDESLVLPDNLELLPGSGSLPKVSGPEPSPRPPG